MNKQEIYDFLSSHGVQYEAVEHGAVFTVEELDAAGLPYPELGAKNLFLRDQKKQNYYLLTVREHLPVKIKEFEKKIGAKHLSFASEDDLMAKMGLVRGSVTPLGALANEDKTVQVYIDSFFDGKRIGVHPCENTATVYLPACDLVSLIKEHGNSVSFVLMDDDVL